MTGVMDSCEFYIFLQSLCFLFWNKVLKTTFCFEKKIKQILNAN